MVLRFSLVRATMTRSSEEMRAWRGDGGEVLVGEGCDGQVVGGDASLSGESGGVLVGEGDDDQDVGGDASWEL